MEVGLTLEIASFALLVITSILMAVLAFLALSFSAKPKLKLSLRDGGKRIKLMKGERRVVRFYAENVGHWYARPAARNVILYVSFQQPIEPIGIRYGSNLEKVNRNASPGKANSKYLKATGVFLFHEEPGEEVEVDVIAPTRSGLYYMWISAHADEGGCGIHRFRVEVLDDKCKGH